MITSVVLASLELCSGSDYFLDPETVAQLESMVEVEPLLTDMEGRHPYLVGWVPKERLMTLPIKMGGASTTIREAAYAALVTALAPRYVRLDFTNGVTTKGWDVLVSRCIPEPRYLEAAVAILAADPVAA